MQIIDIIDDVKDGKQRSRDWTQLAGIAVHRCGVDLQSGNVLGYDGKSVCDAFLGRAPQWAAVAKATGGENAYSLYIGGDLGPSQFDGKIWQALPLAEIGYHARRFSKPYLGIGCIGDFREKPPSAAQRAALVDLLVELCQGLSLRVKDIHGHGEIKGAHDGSKAPGKPAACPGDLLNMDDLRFDVGRILKDRGLRVLAESGLVFE